MRKRQSRMLNHEKSCENSAINILLQFNQHTEFQQYNMSTRFNNINKLAKKQQEIATWTTGFPKQIHTKQINKKLILPDEQKRISVQNKLQRTNRQNLNATLISQRLCRQSNQNFKLNQICQRLTQKIKPQQKRRQLTETQNYRQKCVISIISPEFKQQTPLNQQKQLFSAKTNTSLQMKRLIIRQNFNERKKALIRRIKKDLMKQLQNKNEKIYNTSTLIPCIESTRNYSSSKKTSQQNILNQVFMRFNSKYTDHSTQQIVQQEIKNKQERASKSRTFRQYYNIKQSIMRNEKEKLRQKTKRFNSEILTSSNQFIALQKLLKLQKDGINHAISVTQY